MGSSFLRSVPNARGVFQLPSACLTTTTILRPRRVAADLIVSPQIHRLWRRTASSQLPESVGTLPSSVSTVDLPVLSGMQMLCDPTNPSRQLESPKLSRQFPFRGATSGFLIDLQNLLFSATATAKTRGNKNGNGNFGSNYCETTAPWQTATATATAISPLKNNFSRQRQRQKKLPTVKVNFHGKNCLAPANCLDGFTGDCRRGRQCRTPRSWYDTRVVREQQDTIRLL